MNFGNFFKNIWCMCCEVYDVYFKHGYFEANIFAFVCVILKHVWVVGGAALVMTYWVDNSTFIDPSNEPIDGNLPSAALSLLFDFELRFGFSSG